MFDFLRGLGILVGGGLVILLVVRIVVVAYACIAAFWDFMVTKGFMILLAILLGVVALAALVAVITFIGRISRGKWRSETEQWAGNLLIG